MCRVAVYKSGLVISCGTFSQQVWHATSLILTFYTVNISQPMENFKMSLETILTHGGKWIMEIPADFLGFAGLYLLVFLFTWNWFVLRGAAGCFLAAAKQYGHLGSLSAPKAPAA